MRYGANSVHPEIVIDSDKISDREVIPLQEIVVQPVLKREPSFSLQDIVNSCRLWCFHVVTSKYFERFIIVVVLLNTIMLGFVDYSDPWETGPNPTKFRNRCIDFTNDVTLAIFIFEAILKIIALGIFSGEHSYLHDNWDKLDAVIIVSG